MSSRIFDRLASTETFASRGQKERKKEVEQDGRRGGFDSSKSRIFDRLATTETYASRRQKERKKRVKQDGRPLFDVDVEEQTQIPDLKPANSSCSMSTSSTFSSQSQNSSYSFRSSRTTQYRPSNVFDRLASTNTQSSSRKDRRSEKFDKENRGDSCNLTKEQALTREFQGSTLIKTRVDENINPTSYEIESYKARILHSTKYSGVDECGEI